MAPSILTIGSNAPNFRLKATDGKHYALNNFANAELLIIFFTCNHCPYVLQSDEVTRQLAEKYKALAAFAAINSNSDLAYPEDSFQKMKERMQECQFPWVYLHDPKQETAIVYGAERTPHFFLFDKNRHLIYSGRCNDSPLDPSKITVNDLENAMTDYLQKNPVRTPITVPIGCSIKWLQHHLKND